MLTLPFPTPGTFAYPMKSFSGLNNLRRIVRFNQKAYRDYLDQSALNLENQHPLVGILQQLAIDPTWDLDYVIRWTQFQAYSLATPFKINSISGVGGIITNGLYGEGCAELWSLIEHDRAYDPDTLRLEDLRPVVPIYSTLLERGYKSIVERSKDSTRLKGHVALVGINMVDLAIGWWLWMRNPENDGTGIHHYLCMWPLYTAQLLHNQSMTINWLYEFFVKEGNTKNLFLMDQVKFTTLSEQKLMREWFTFKADFLTSRKLVDIGHFIASIESFNGEHFFNYETGGPNRLLVQTSWFWQPAVIKWFTVYMTLFNRLGYTDKQIKPTLQRILPSVLKGFEKCPSTFCRDHFKGKALELSNLISRN